MKKYLINRIQSIWTPKTLRKQKFGSRVKNRRRHQARYGLYQYQSRPKSNRFNRWQDYKRLTNRFY